MRRYFFDTDDGDTFDFDGEGVEFVDFATARESAISALTEMASTTLADSEHRRLSVTIRDEAENVVYTGSLVFEGRRLTTRLGNSEGLLSGKLYDPERPGPTESCLTDVK